MSTQVQYIGTQPCDQPSLDVSWIPGDIKTLDDAIAAQLTAEGNPFVVHHAEAVTPSESMNTQTQLAR
jgi:hypothetical protein